jgi:hypothetical protein
VLAYLFWHRPLPGVEIGAYERTHLAFHRSLAHAPPIGLRGSAVLRAAELPWLAPASSADVASGLASVDGAGYEDWYFVEDYTALGVLNEAAVGRGHRSTHDEVARRFGAGAGGLYGLVEGDPPDPRALGAATAAVWVARRPGSARRALGELLGDGIDPRQSSLWRRQLVFGPAPEFCLMAAADAAGVASTRLPAGWSATTYTREVLWSG